MIVPRGFCVCELFRGGKAMNGGGGKIGKAIATILLNAAIKACKQIYGQVREFAKNA